MMIKINPKPPYNFELSTRIFSDSDEKVRKSKKGKFWQVLKTGDNLILVTVESSGTIDKPELSVVLQSNSEITTKDRNAMEETIVKIFNLKLDLQPFYQEISRDKVMSRVADGLYGLKNPTTPTFFEALVDSIVEQQISLKAAHSIENRLIKSFGPVIGINGTQYYNYPSPEDLAFLELSRLREIGLSFRKAEYIKDLSFNIVNGVLDLESLGKLEKTSDMVEELLKIRGVGRWTGELAVLRGLGRLDSMPADDLGLRRVISHYYCEGERINATKARDIAKSWGQWQGLAAYYLIVADLMSL
jgi:DNA-3-methyladenine glycosylase II